MNENLRLSLINTFNKLKSKGLFAGHKDYGEWEKRNEKKDENKIPPKIHRKPKI